MLKSKTLNKTNSAYGHKKSKTDWKIAVTHVLGSETGGFYFEGIKDSYESGAYSRAIASSLKRLKEFRSIADLEKMTEADLVNFYYLGMAFLEFGELSKAVSCFHIIVSQEAMVDSMLGGYATFIPLARHELEKIAKDHGQDFVNDNDPNLFLQQKRGAGCFIATAVYREEYAHDIVTLKVFRDMSLLSFPSGRMLIKLYYRMSPPMAQLLQKHPKASALIRNFIIHPLAMTIRSRFINSTR